MAKLHENLAVVGELEGASNSIQNEARNTFVKKQALFMGFEKNYEPFADVEKVTQSISESKPVDTTVQEKLDYMFSHVVRSIDATLQRERTNQDAFADIEVDGAVIAKDVPATFLLGLESKLKMWREVLGDIPTLQPGIEWEPAENEREGIYTAKNLQETFKTKKIAVHKVLVDPTPQHRAEIEKWFEDTPVGKYTNKLFSGAMSSAEKSELLGRLDKLSRAVKQARQRANNVEVVDAHIGESLVNYLMEK